MNKKIQKYPTKNSFERGQFFSFDTGHFFHLDYFDVKRISIGSVNLFNFKFHIFKIILSISLKNHVTQF